MFFNRQHRKRFVFFERNQLMTRSDHLNSMFRQKYFPGFSRTDLIQFRAYYMTQFKTQKNLEQKVGWNSKKGQKERFEIFLKIGELNHQKLLDIGCGLGAFCQFLYRKKISAQYIGIDLFPEILQTAQQMNPQGYFEVRHLLMKPYPAGRFDFSFLSGLFNIQIQDNWKYMKSILTVALKQTKKAVAFNILNRELVFQESNRFSVNAAEIVRFARQLPVRQVKIFDHYHPVDLTLFLYK